MNLRPEDYGFESIEGKAVLLTGASGGIGRASALLLARAGARLALMARSEGKLRSLAEEIAALGAPEALVLAGDVRDEQACDNAVAATAERFGRIDVLVNNAGVGFPTDLANVSTEDYRRIIETNVTGVFFLTRAVLPVMKRQKSGHVVMVSSGAGGHANPVAPLYCASKFALEGYTDGLRKQLDALHAEGVHVRVTDIWPGGVDSGYWGTRDVPRHTFMTCQEMACFVLQVIAAQSTVNVTDLRVHQFRFKD